MVVARELTALRRGGGGAIPALGGREAALGVLPELARCCCASAASAYASPAPGGVAELLAQLAEALEELPARDHVLERRRAVGDDLRGLLELPGLLEELRGGRERAVVLGREASDARPRLGRGAEIAPLLLVERRELLLERDLRVDVAGGVRLGLEHVREIVPALRLLEDARERLARGVVAAIEREELLERGDRAVDVAEVAFADAGDLAEALLARLERLARARRRRARSRGARRAAAA